MEALVPDGPFLELLFGLPSSSVFSASSVLSLSDIHPVLLAYLCPLREETTNIITSPEYYYCSDEINTIIKGRVSVYVFKKKSVYIVESLHKCKIINVLVFIWTWVNLGWQSE